MPAVEEQLFGLDIYSGQGYPDMALLEQENHSFVISKATGEGNYINPYWEGNRRAVRDTKMIFGTYDWVEPQSGMTGAQAALDYWKVINYYGAINPGELVTVDYETPIWMNGPYGRNIEPFMRDYMFTLSDLAKQPIGIYTARYFLEETGAVNWIWLNDPRFYYWQAAPGEGAMMADDSFWPATTAPFVQTVIHQHQWHAISKAVQMEFDRNRFWGTFADLLKYGKPGDTVPIILEGEVKEPPPGKVAWYVNEKFEPIFVWNGGGQTRKVTNVNIVDIGMEVESFTEPGVLLDISIQNGVAGDYHERREPDAFVAADDQAAPDHKQDAG